MAGAKVEEHEAHLRLLSDRTKEASAAHEEVLKKTEEAMKRVPVLPNIVNGPEPRAISTPSKTARWRGWRWPLARRSACPSTSTSTRRSHLALKPHFPRLTSRRDGPGSCWRPDGVLQERRHGVDASQPRCWDGGGGAGACRGVSLVRSAKRDGSRSAGTVRPGERRSWRETEGTAHACVM